MTRTRTRTKLLKIRKIQSANKHNRLIMGFWKNQKLQNQNPI